MGKIQNKMTVVFRIGKDGNGTVYSGRSEKEIKNLVKDYEKQGWQVTHITTVTDTGTVWYQIDEERKK